MKLRPLIIGSRGSDLALKQSAIVAGKLQKLGIQTEIKIITTKGDKTSDPIPLDVVGKGWFTKEIESELLAGSIDLAVHSLKDLPEVVPTGLCIGAIPEREDPRDVLVSKGGERLEELKKGAVIGTDSLRRKVQVLEVRPDLLVESIRGNVPTRLKKMREGQYDAVVLAAAGLLRLGLEDQITQYFELEQMSPAPGQGALAIEVREGDAALRQLLTSINDPVSELTATAERTFSQAVGGGCKQPVGAYASCEDGLFTLQAMVAPSDCSRILRDSVSGSCEQSLELSRGLAEKMVKQLG